MWLWLVVGLRVLLWAQPLEIRQPDLEQNEKYRYNTGWCNGKFTCKHNGSSTLADYLRWRDINCYCDELCRIYGDCCLDSSFYKLEEQRLGFPFTCVNVRQFHYRQYDGIYMKNRCPSAWRDPRVRAKCETGSVDNRDPVAELPATSLNTGIIYRNFYCALCNGDTRLELWNIRIVCPSLEYSLNLSQENFINMLVYNVTERPSGWGINHAERFYHCILYPIMTSTAASHLIRLCQADTIQSCAVSWTNNDIRTGCEAYTSLVYFEFIGYRNPHCALCNNVSLTSLSCSQSISITAPTEIMTSTRSFAVLLDISGGETVGKIRPCKSNQIYDPFIKQCRSVISDISEPEDLFAPYNSTNNITEKQAPAKKQKCKKYILNSEHFVIGNGSVFVPAYGKTLKDGEYEIMNGTLELCVDSLKNPFANKFGEYMGFMTCAGLGISIVFLIIHLTAFSLVAELRNFSGMNLASLCVSLLVGYTAFMAGQLLTPQTAPCFVVALITYYSFLAAFAWMLTMSFEVWRALKLASTKLRIPTGGKQWRKFTIYSFFSWLVPLIIVSLTVFIENLPKNSIPQEYRPEFAFYSCWFGQRRALLLYFAAPLGVIMAMNMAFFASSAHMIYSTTSTARLSASAGTKRDFGLYIRLGLLMGLTWAVGIIAGLLDSVVLWYTFVLLNTLQGLFIFLAFTCNNKGKRACKKTDRL